MGEPPLSLVKVFSALHSAFANSPRGVAGANSTLSYFLAREEVKQQGYTENNILDYLTTLALLLV